MGTPSPRVICCFSFSQDTLNHTQARPLPCQDSPFTPPPQGKVDGSHWRHMVASVVLQG